jgi:hypothetical protein
VLEFPAAFWSSHDALGRVWGASEPKHFAETFNLQKMLNGGGSSSQGSGSSGCLHRSMAHTLPC